MEMWIQNDGFLQRLAQLSQSEFTFDPQLMKSLRKDLQKQKAMETMESAFLGSLESTIFTDFDPRGDETLAALQGRLAEEYTPHNVSDASDLSPLLEIFQDNASDQSMATHSRMWSEVLAAMVYEKFQNTDLRDRDEAKRLGREIRNFFLREDRLTKNDIEEFCGSKITPESLKRIYGF
jgi:Zn-dependent oligopeptidase